MKRNPFGFTETAADRYLREERESAKLFQDALGGLAVATAIRKATEVRNLMRDVDFDRPYRGVLDALERDRKERASLKALTNTAWALSVTETARNIAERHAGLFEDQRRLSGSVLDTVKAFNLNRSTVASAIAAANNGDSVRRLIAEALPRISSFGAIAEQMRLVDAMTLRASEGIVQSATALAAEMVLETQRIADAIVAAPTDAESIELQGKLLELIVGFVARLGPNTITELQNMGLFQWSGWIAGILGLLLTVAAMNPEMSQQEKAAFGDLNQKVEQLQQETHRYYEAEGRAEEAYVANLPRAELARNATLRRKPERAGAVVMEAPKGMLLAIEKSEGRWRLVVFRDPLSNQLARAWVYETAVTLLAPALDSGEG